MGPLYAGEIVDDGKAVRFVWGSDRQWTETVPMEHVERNPEPRPPRNRIRLVRQVLCSGGSRRRAVFPCSAVIPRWVRTLGAPMILPAKPPRTADHPLNDYQCEWVGVSVPARFFPPPSAREPAAISHPRPKAESWRCQ